MKSYKKIFTQIFLFATFSTINVFCQTELRKENTDEESKTFREQMAEYFHSTKNLARMDKELSNIPNILLVGPPGTGKTMFAEYIGQVTKRQYSIATFASEITTELVKSVLDYAEARNRFIILDECDSFAVSRDRATHDQKAMLNVFLSRISGQTTKYGLCAMTNRLQDLDEAFKSRFQFIIQITLPGFETRKNIINEYKDDFIKTKKKVAFAYSKQAEKIFTNDLIEKMAKETDGFSGRMIKGVFDIIEHSTILLRKPITQEIIFRSIKEAGANRDLVKGLI